MNAPRSTAADYWWQALATPAGIVIETDNPTRLTQQLYQARTAALAPELNDLAVVQSPENPAHVWIVRKGR